MFAMTEENAEIVSNQFKKDRRAEKDYFAIKDKIKQENLFNKKGNKLSAGEFQTDQQKQQFERMGRMIKLQKHLTKIQKKQIEVERSRQKQSIYACCADKRNKEKKEKRQEVKIASFMQSSISAAADEKIHDINYLEDLYLKDERRKEDLGLDDDEEERELELQKNLAGGSSQDKEQSKGLTKMQKWHIQKT